MNKMAMMIEKKKRKPASLQSSDLSKVTGSIKGSSEMYKPEDISSMKVDFKKEIDSELADEAYESGKKALDEMGDKYDELIKKRMKNKKGK